MAQATSATTPGQDRLTQIRTSRAAMVAASGWRTISRTSQPVSRASLTATMMPSGVR